VAGVSPGVQIKKRAEASSRTMVAGRSLRRMSTFVGDKRRTDAILLNLSHSFAWCGQWGGRTLFT